MSPRLPVLVLVAFGLSGCSLLDAGPRAEVGDCVDMATLRGREVTDIPTLECTRDHDGQVAVSFTAPEGDFPSEQEWEDLVGEECRSGFEGFVGTVYDDSTLDVFSLTPTADSWEGGDREVLCIAYLTDGSTTTRSFQGSGL